MTCHACEAERVCLRGRVRASACVLLNSGQGVRGDGCLGVGTGGQWADGAVRCSPTGSKHRWASVGTAMDAGQHSGGGTFGS